MDQLEVGQLERIPFLESVLDGLGQGMLVVDERQTVTASNATLRAIVDELGLRLSPGQSLAALLSPFRAGSARSERVVSAIMAAAITSEVLEPMRIRFSSETLEIRGNPLAGVGYLFTVEHISRKAASDGERRIGEILDHSPVGVNIVGPDGLRRYGNRKIREMLGLNDATMMTSNARDNYADPGLRDRILKEMWEKGAVENREAEFVRPDGTHYWVLLSCRPFEFDGEDCILGWLYEITDRVELEHKQMRSREELEIQILELRDREERMAEQAAELESLAIKLAESERKMAELANYDMLTGLPTLRLCHDRIESGMANARRNQTLMALIYVDLDGFKQVNDTLGHDAGDQVLKEAASRMRHCFRETDTVARIGGDEFLVVLWGLGFRDAILPLADRLLACFGEDFLLDSGTAHIGASIGIAFFDGSSDTPGSLIKRADKAMYLAKKGGKNRYVIG